MDPNKALKYMRELIEEILKDSDLEQPVNSDDAYELMVYTKSLDEWLTKGGFLPTDWQFTVGQ
jgi:hypothetical protein